MQNLYGSNVALITPMLTNGDVDYPTLGQLIDSQISAGTHAIVSVGTTGESATLTIDEHISVIEYTVKHVNKRIPVIAGTGANSTSEAIELTKSASEVNVDACLIVVPYYNKPTQEGLYQHFKAIADAVSIPQVLYNVPSRTQLDMHNETVERLAVIDNIIGIKDASCDLVKGRDLIERVADKMDVVSGDDATALQHIQLGGKGNISVTANIAPAYMSQMCEAALTGDANTAQILSDKLAALNNDLFVESNPIPIKWALARAGMAGSTLRLPMTELSAQHHSLVEAAMRKADVQF